MVEKNIGYDIAVLDYLQLNVRSPLAVHKKLSCMLNVHQHSHSSTNREKHRFEGVNPSQMDVVLIVVAVWAAQKVQE